jgi:tetratricopeptide (TPR) repeat protein
LLAPVLILCAGCASHRLESARENFYLGRPDRAAANLAVSASRRSEKVLLLMERGMIHQERGDFKTSARDWEEAVDLARDLDYYSISRGTASFAVNDRVLAHRGAPYERTLLHTFNAKNYLARQMWDDAAVEARNIISDLEHLEGFPDDAYSRYMAGVCLELIRDYEGSKLQYGIAAKMVPEPAIDGRTGRIASSSPAAPPAELICFVVLGRSPLEYGSWTGNHKWGTAPYATIESNGKRLGRSYTFSNTRSLMVATEKRTAALRAAKTAVRVAIKEAAAQMVEEENELLGEMLRLYLFALESPARQRWETLPLWLQVARVPCQPGLKQFRIAFRSEDGRIIEEETVSKPLVRRDRIFISFCRAL